MAHCFQSYPTCGTLNCYDADERCGGHKQSLNISTGRLYEENFCRRNQFCDGGLTDGSTLRP